jgi:hypothetical protein
MYLRIDGQLIVGLNYEKMLICCQNTAIDLTLWLFVIRFRSKLIVPRLLRINRENIKNETYLFAVILVPWF